LTVTARGDSPSSRIDAELDSNLRENIKLSEEMLTLIKSERGNDICEQLSILSALRSADTDSSTSRATNTGKSRDRQNKRKLTDATMDDRDSIAADSPVAPSPKIPGKERLLQKSGSSRAGSAVPTVREGSVKGEDESEHAKGKNTRSSASSNQKKKGGLR
jgi:SAGA-associated factor 29